MDESSGKPERTVFAVGTRKSVLALRQTQEVVDLLQALYSNFSFPIVSKETLGDQIQTLPLHNIEAKSLWTKDLEDLLIAGHCDFIVHSLKDMPTILSNNCVLGAILKREDPRDVVVMKATLTATYRQLSDLPEGAIVGTSSVRRAAQLKRRYTHLQFADIRGNVGTRLSKLDAADSPYTCIVLAYAGLKRLNLHDRISQYLSHPDMLHAVGQGALGVEIRSQDAQVAEMVQRLHHYETGLCCLAERALMRTLEGGCSVPIGVESAISDDKNSLSLRGIVVAVDGTRVAEAFLEQENVHSVEIAEAAGINMARKLLMAGGEEILRAINVERGERVEGSGNQPSMIQQTAGR